ncbi:MAG: cohesin domain-containing protein [Candidatus Paceibacterota bacterium]
MNVLFQSNIQIKFFILASFFAALGCVPFLAQAADVFLTPATGSYAANQTFTVTVMADPKGDSINAVEAEMSFDTSALSVVSVSKTGSAFSLWTTEPTFSNTAGTIAFGGGSPTPFSNRSTLVSITFRAKTEGAGAVGFTNASALAADGQGTDVLESSPGANYTVTAATTPVTPTETPNQNPAQTADSDAAIAFGDPPRAPEVGSQTFLDPDLWYNTVEGIFTWQLPFDVSAVAVEIATSSENEPSEVFDPPVEEFELSRRNAIDGVQYLSIQFKNQVGWGAITNRVIKIDTTPPEAFKIAVQASNSQHGFPLVTFDAQDAVSGIARYELFVADREPVEITPEEAKLGYLLGELEDGTYTVKVIAYDLAGNATESTTPVLITAGWSKEVASEEGASFWSLFTPINLLVALLFVIVLLLLGYIFYQRRLHTQEEEKLRKETREIQDQMEKIFSALRDEIYDQVRTITKRPRLSKRKKSSGRTESSPGGLRDLD